MGKKADNQEYEAALESLQIELVKLQRHVIATDERLLILIEGRDGGGKDGLIKRITEHMSPRETRVVALSKPSDRERSSWYFQRYVPYLPAADEIVLFNRSWYNRAGVEKVMGFCKDKEYAAFMASVIPFEYMIQDAGIRMFKYYLDISKAEQAERLEDRRRDPLKQWKISPIDAVALEKFDDYSKARDAMFKETSVKRSPWFVVSANEKKKARLNVMRHLLGEIDYKGKDESLLKVDKDIVFTFEKGEEKRLER